MQWSILTEDMTWLFLLTCPMYLRSVVKGFFIKIKYFRLNQSQVLLSFMRASVCFVNVLVLLTFIASRFRNVHCFWLVEQAARKVVIQSSYKRKCSVSNQVLAGDLKSFRENTPFFHNQMLTTANWLLILSVAYYTKLKQTIPYPWTFK